MLVGFFSPLHSVHSWFVLAEFETCKSRAAKPAVSQALLEPAEGRREQRFCLSPLRKKFRGKGRTATGLFPRISQNKSGAVELIMAFGPPGNTEPGGADSNRCHGKAAVGDEGGGQAEAGGFFPSFIPAESCISPAFLPHFSCISPAASQCTPIILLPHPEQGGCSIKPLQWWPKFPCEVRSPSMPCGTWHPFPWHSSCQPCPTLRESREYLHWVMLSWCSSSCPWR